MKDAKKAVKIAKAFLKALRKAEKENGRVPSIDASYDAIIDAATGETSQITVADNGLSLQLGNWNHSWNGLTQ